MKSAHNKSEQPKAVEWKFPCLGVSDNGQVVLFVSDSQGTRVDDKIYYSETWNMRCFTPLPSTESITLSND